VSHGPHWLARRPLFGPRKPCMQQLPRANHCHSLTKLGYGSLLASCPLLSSFPSRRLDARVDPWEESIVPVFLRTESSGVGPAGSGRQRAGRRPPRHHDCMTILIMSPAPLCNSQSTAKSPRRPLCPVDLASRQLRRNVSRVQCDAPRTALSRLHGSGPAEAGYRPTDRAATLLCQVRFFLHLTSACRSCMLTCQRPPMSEGKTIA
jgi:hypothetical protein